MTFKQFFKNKYPELQDRWAYPGELFSSVIGRFLDTMSEYVDYHLYLTSEKE